MYFQENRVNSVLPAALHTEVNSVIIIRVIKKRKIFEIQQERDRQNIWILIRWLPGELGVKRWQVDAAVKLIDEGNTIPFIARYRKEVTGTLDDAQLRTLHERLMYLRNLEEKERTGSGKYRRTGKAYRRTEKADPGSRDNGSGRRSLPPIPGPKRRTRAMIAKEKGHGTADSTYHTSESGETDRSICGRICEFGEEVKSVKEAIDGAKDIIAESVSDEADTEAGSARQLYSMGK